MSPCAAPRSLRLSLPGYFLIEALNSSAATLFVLSIFFWTRRQLAFGDAANLWLGVVQGLGYMVFSRVGGWLADRLGYDRSMIRAVSLAACALPLLLLIRRPFTPYLVMALYTVSMAIFWAAAGAAVAHAPGRWSMPRRVAIYNIIWSLAGAVGFFASGALFDWRPDAVIVLPVLLHLVQLAVMVRRRPDTATAGARPTAAPLAAAVASARHPRFMHAAWLANALGYYVVTSFGTLAPHVGERLGLTPRLTIWMTCALLLARGLAFLGFGWWEGWHYRLRWLISAILLLPALLAVSFYVPHVGLVCASQAAMGVLLGLIYSSSLYYSLDQGASKAKATGRHEAMVGLGILAGPLIGVAGAHWVGGASGAKMVLLAVYLLVAAAGLMIVLRPSASSFVSFVASWWNRSPSRRTTVLNHTRRRG